MSKDQRFKDFQLAGQMMMKPEFQFDRLSTYDKQERDGSGQKASHKSKGTQDKPQGKEPYSAPQLPEQDPMASSGDAMDVPQVEKPKPVLSKVLDKTRDVLGMARKGAKSGDSASAEARAGAKKDSEKPADAKNHGPVGTNPGHEDSAATRKSAGNEDSAGARKDADAEKKEGDLTEKKSVIDGKDKKASDGKAADKVAKPVADKPDGKAGKAGKAARKDGAKNSRSGGKGKAASGRRGGGGGSFGANAPTVSPKGPGTGANAIQAYAGSGVSYQVEHYGSLGKEMAGDLGDSRNSLNDQLPGEKKVQGNAKGNQALEGSAQSAKAGNQSNGKSDVKSPVKNVLDNATKSVKKMLEEQKRRARRSRDEQLPEKPTVDRDNSAIDAARAEEAECVTNAQASAEDAANGLDRTLPTRGFDDIQVAKPEITVDVSDIATSDLAGMEEVAMLEDEAKGLLDISEIADPTSQKMAEAAKSIDDAEAASKQATEEKIAERNAAVDQAKLEAEQGEKKLIETKRIELDKRIDSETDQYNQQLASYDEAQQKEITAAQEQLDAERTRVQSTIDAEHARAEAEKKKAEKESENDDRSLLEKGIDWLKSQAKKLKDRISKIIDDVKQAICNALDRLAEFAARIDKDLGARIKAITDELKVQVEAYAESLKQAVNEYIDEVVDNLIQIAEDLSAMYDSIVQAFNDAMDAIVGALKSAYESVVSFVESALDFLGEVFVYILRKACDVVGVNPDVFIPAAKNIVQHPIDFLSTLWEGIKQGGYNFIKNFADNALVMLRNLFALWLEPSGIKIPENIPSLTGFIEIGFNVIGIDLNGILSKLEGLSQSDKKDDSDEEEPATPDELGLDSLLTAIKTGGISVLVDRIAPLLGGIDTEIIQAVVAEMAPKLITKGLERLVMMANPATGIISAIKGAWDLVQFFIERFEAIKGLAASIMNVMASCAYGDCSAAAAAMEAGLCQFLPIAADLLIRLLGFNVGGEIKKIVKRIGGKIRNVVDKFIGKFNKKTGAHIKTSTERAKAKKDREQNYENAKRVREQNVNSGNASLSDRMGRWGDKTSSRISYKKDKLENDRVFDPTGLSNMFEGKKVGNLGINLNNSEYVKAIDEHNELKRVHRKLDKVGGDPKKLSRADQKVLWKEQSEKTSPGYKEKNLWGKLKEVHDRDNAEDDYKKKKKESKKAQKDQAKKAGENAQKDKTKEPLSKKPTQQMLDNTFDNIDAGRLGNKRSNFGVALDAEARFNGVSAVDRMDDSEAARYEAYWKSKEPEIAANEQRKAEEASHVITATPADLEAHKKQGEAAIAASAARGRAIREKYKDVTVDVDANIQKRVEIAEERKKAEAAGWVKKDGSTWWPDNKRGFDAIPGTVRPQTLQPGEVISRFSGWEYEVDKNRTNDEGTYFARDGESKTARAMAPMKTGQKADPEYKYEILKPFTVTASNATPWFGEKGGARQYNVGTATIVTEDGIVLHDVKTKDLVEHHYIKILTPKEYQEKVKDKK